MHSHGALLLRELFDDDESAADERGCGGSGSPAPDDDYRGDAEQQVGGLALLRAYLRPEEQQRLLHLVQAEQGWLEAEQGDSSEAVAGAMTAPAPAAAGEAAAAGTPQAAAQAAAAAEVAAGTQRRNQVIIFGTNNMPPWLRALGEELQRHLPPALMPPLLPSEQPQPLQPQQQQQPFAYFNTAIVNTYRRGDGITPHVDLLRFADGIAVVSLGGPAVMRWRRADAAAAGVIQATAAAPGRQACCASGGGGRLEGGGGERRTGDCQLLLRGGDALLLCGEARYAWAHGIDAAPRELLSCRACCAQRRRGGGSSGRGISCAACVPVERGLRVSLTLRRLAPGGGELTTPAD